MSKRWLFRLSALSAALVPVGFLAASILAYGVNVPYWDQWGVADRVLKAFDGTLTLSDFMVQQNEARLVFPYLLFIGLAYLTGYDIRYEMWGSFCLACLVLYNVHRLGRLTLSGKRRQEVFLLFLASLLITSLAQWQNWFWGFQLIVYIPLVCVTSILSLAYSQLAIGTKFVASAGLATLSTFSFANGMLCWVLVLPILVLQTWEQLKKKPWWIGCWLLGFIVNVGLYFYNYTKPPWHPSFTEVLTHPFAAVSYFLAFLGAPLGWGTHLQALDQAIGVGCGIGILFVLACGVIWQHRHESRVLYRTLGWLTLGSYTLASAGVTTLGRLGFGMQQALESRYVAFSIPLLVALIYLVPLVLDIYGQQRLPQGDLWIARCTTVLSTVLILLHLITTSNALAAAESQWRSRLQGKALLLFIKTLPKEALTRLIAPDLAPLKLWAEGLDRHGLLSPGLRHSLRIEHDELRQTNRIGSCGWFDSLQRTAGETYLAQGWAVLPHWRRPADGIVLAYEESNGTFTIFDLVTVRTLRPDVAQALRRPGYAHAGWEHAWRPPQGERKPLKITAWALDADTGHLCKLNKAYVVEEQEPEIREVK